MPFDLTNPVDLAVLRAHLTSLETVKALDAHIKSRDDEQIAVYYNTVQDTLRVPRGIITRSMFVGDCQRLGIWAKLIQLRGTAPTAFAEWSFYLDKILPLLDSFD